MVPVADKIIDSLFQTSFQLLLASGITTASAIIAISGITSYGVTAASGITGITSHRITSYGITGQRNHCSQRDYQLWNHWPAKSLQPAESLELLVIESLASEITAASVITAASGITSHGITSQRNHCSQRNHQLWNHQPAKSLQPAQSLQPAESLVMELLASEITAASGITDHYSSHYSSHYSQRNYITILLQSSLLGGMGYSRDILFHAKVLRIYYAMGRYQ